MEFWQETWSSMSVQFEYLLRIVVACICGGAIGIERTLRQKEAGFRTHVIVGLGAALMMIISKYGFFDVVGYNSIQLDASRVSSNIITGISFLGAGMIFLKGRTIKGLTTAAGIWATAAVGMAIGCGLYFTGIVTTIIIIVIQIVFHTFLIGFDKVLANDNSNEILAKLRYSPEAVSRFRDQLKKHNMIVLTSKIEKHVDDTITVILTVKMSDNDVMDESIEFMDENPDIISIMM